MTELNLSLLRIFIAVHRAGSFTRAATLLGLSQPTVTARIRSLETAVRQQLFIRQARGIVTTAAGEALARQVGVHLDALSVVAEQQMLVGDPLRATLHVAGPAELFAARVLPDLAELVQLGLRLRVTYGLAADLLDGLAAGRHELVVSTIRPRRQGISQTPLTDEELLLVGSKEWASRIPPERLVAEGPAALAEAPFATYAEDLPLIRRYWLGVFEQAPTRCAQVVVPDLRAILGLVATGSAISVLPRYLCDEAIANGDVVALLEPSIPPINTLFLATRTGALSAPHLAHVHRHLLQRAKHW